MRFLAAFAVLSYHFEPRGWYKSPGLLFELTHAGTQAVAFFFLLSGFILVYAHCTWDRGLNLGARSFYVARLARILPSYWFALLISSPFFLYSYAVSHQIGTSIFLPSLLLTPNLLQAWYAPVAQIWNMPAWSLSVEAFFYCLFPAIWLLARRVGSWAFLTVSVLALGIAAIAQQLCEAEAAGKCAAFLGPEIWVVNPIIHLPKFLFGMALGGLFIENNIKSQRIFDVIFLVTACSLVLSIATFSGANRHLGELPIVVLFGLLVFGAARSTIASRIFGRKSFIVLGEASYALYLLHVPLSIWLNWFYGKYGANIPSEYVTFVIRASIIVVVSILTYRFIEVPMRTKFILWLR